jgi:large subunit ribosomal protein L5
MGPVFKSWYDITVRNSLLNRNVQLSLDTKNSSLRNVHEIPKVVKIQINQSLGLMAQNTQLLKKSLDEFRLISGQQPVVTKSRKAIAGFKIRKDLPLGLTVTLRGKRMYSFLARLIHLTLPRIRDFQGLDPKGMDNHGNYNIGLADQLIFSEIDYDKVKQNFGFDIAIVTTAKNREDGLILLKQLGVPFQD